MASAAPQDAVDVITHITDEPVQSYGPSAPPESGSGACLPSVTPAPGDPQLITDTDIEDSGYDTPIKHGSSTMVPFSTNARYRINTINGLGKEVLPFAVGPMPVQQFLDEFFPSSQLLDHGYTPLTNQPLECFEQTIQCTSEVPAYCKFVHAMSAFNFDLSFVDVSSKGDIYNCKSIKYDIKPDVCIYPLNIKTPDRCDVTKAEMMVEFKWNKGDDPFSTLSSASLFIMSSQQARDTMGQITAYASAQLGAQWRTHAYQILIIKNYARLIRWDHEGFIVTEPISIESLLPLSISSDATMLHLMQCMAMTKPFPVLHHMQTAHSDLTYLVPALVATGLSPIGHNTRGFSAYNTKGDRVVFLKDTWCVLLLDIIPEGDVYKCLNEKHVRHVATCLAFGDVLGGSNAHTTQTGHFKDAPWARPTGAILIAHVHYRLVLNIVATPITSFISSRQVVEVVRDALIAHQDAYEDCDILHCDLSVGNIMVRENEGILIDWDLAKLTQDSGPRQITRTGTWQFMSARLVADMNTPHNFQDDMDDAQRSHFLHTTLDPEQVQGSGGSGKANFLQLKSSITSTTPLFKGRPALDALMQQLQKMFSARYIPSMKEAEENV
ncbi:uncharacterized protein F5147DRAFT_781478 [Suillus discolor]|uniref:Fungal-type protein kinase domain-containing protein n=1 Tax=Suillus discolor TaxID=1912936 RepID=A0A9P7ES11_9AGAM|nr:uncharacterized protein F5147DRAFT_781478 [Suillus discolor]KAG2086971.1 hypothetical protein F5147DRAFT_781478 [Suillus discolor]